MANKKHKPVRRHTRMTLPLPAPITAGLREAETLLRTEHAEEAVALLDDLNRRYPGRDVVLSALLDAAYAVQSSVHYLTAAEGLVRLRPDDGDLTAVLGTAYFLNNRPALAMKMYRRFLERWPRHLLAVTIQKNMEELEPVLQAALKDVGFTGEEGFELACLHEEVQSLLEQGRYTEMRVAAEELLRRTPDFAPALNNVGQSYYAEGNLASAMDFARQVLASDPYNVHALSNLTRYLCLTGHLDEARAMAERLLASPADAFEREVKLAEALSYLGDDKRVLDAFKRAKNEESPLLCHLAAVAALRLGREKEARGYWRQALKLDPGHREARENLADMGHPIEERNAPWAFPLNNWLPARAIQDMAAELEPATQVQDEEAVTRAARNYLDKHPEVIELAPLLLDRGDPAGRRFALMMARLAETPELMTALRDFALSQRGPDAMRLEAAQVAVTAGLLDAGAVRMWMHGKWTDLVLLGFEIYNYTEPSDRSPEVEDLIRQGTEAVYAQDWAEGERFLLQAMEIEPDAPDIWNNLAGAYSQQGRMEEARTIIRRVHEMHPDYFFGRTNLAQLYLRERKINEARELLKPLLTVKRMHFSEFKALAGAQIELHLAERQPDAARGWIQMWEQVDPTSDALGDYRLRVGGD